MIALVITVLVSYLLGSIPAGYLAGRLAKVDIRQVGSGNIGATNVTRTLGKRYGYPVFIVDFLKGFLAVRISILVAQRAQMTPTSVELLGILAAVCCVIGHSFPVWLRFQGGKGVATSAGALFALMPLALAIGLAIWLLTFQLTRYVSLASITAAAVLPIAIAVLFSLGQHRSMPLLYFSICLAAVVILRHRSNISRLIRGTESRFKRK